MPKVSIVIPFFKGPVYLEECVNSIEEQKLPDYEIIIVNDKDGHEVPQTIRENPYVKVYRAIEELPEDVIRENEDTAAVWREQKIHERVEKRLHNAERRRNEVEEYKKKGESLDIYTDKELNPEEGELLDEYEEKVGQVYPFGVSYCRNIGLAKATGEYVYFIDCDDYLMEGALSRLLKLAEEKKAVLTTGNKYSTWFKPMNFTFEKAKQETFIEGIQKLEGQVLRDRFVEMYSVQHFLIRRDFIEEHKITFDTDTRFYSDMRFCVQLLKKAEGKCFVDGDSLYIWRHRNDQVHLPALCQKKRGRRSSEFLESYHRSLAFLTEEDTDLRYALDHYLLKFFWSKYPARILRENAPKFAKAMAKMPEWKEISREYGLLERIQLAFTRKGKFRMAKPIMKFNKWRRKKKGIVGSRLQWYRVLERHIFKKMPLRRDWVFIESFFGKSYSDSPKYLYEYLQKTRGDKYRYIWVLNKKSKALAKSGKHTRVKMNSLRYVYYASRCGYRIFNVRQPAWNTKRPGVVFLETWHGTPLKKLAFDMDDITSASQSHKTLFYKHGREWNYLISANRFSTDVFERAFVYNRDKILEYGYPRNDILYAENRDEIASEVKKELGIPEGKRVILYAPTWRDNQFYDRGKYKFTLALDLGRLQKEFGNDSVVLLRTHYYIADILDLSEYEGFVYNGSQYEDVSRLYLASDICITDYSSVFFDYANLKRPILFYAYDYDEYADEIRGMYMDMDKELPGPILHTNDAVVDALHNMDAITETYQERYEEFYERFCSVDDGHASERVIEKVFGEREIGMSHVEE